MKGPKPDHSGDASGADSGRGAKEAGQRLSLRGRALKYLAAREHSRAELARKLAPHAEDADDVAALLDDLQARGLLSEARFVASVLHRRSARLGGARIRQELLSKGVDRDAVAAAVSTLSDSEADRARALWQRRFGVAPSDAREAARQSRFLLARGFSGEVVRAVLKAAAAGQIDPFPDPDDPG